MSYLLTRAEAASRAGEAGAARVWFDSARVQLEDPSFQLPVAAIRNSLLGVALAGLGRADEAVTEAFRATQMVPVSLDALWGTSL
ncbi:MAG TPA: hypothetical protein VGA78_13205 [Gemmatimonadales bacterium]